METWQAIDAIRVIRDFSDEPIGQTQLAQILNAGRRAGSSKNLQRWTFVVVRERDRLERLAATGTFAAHVGRAAVAVALITPDPRVPEAPLSVVFDIGRAAQNMVLAAWNLGIGSCPATVYDQKLVHEVLGIPDDYHCEYILSFGHPADANMLKAPKRAGGRRDLSDVVRYEQWGSEQ
jgi:nitroreductase